MEQYMRYYIRDYMTLTTTALSGTRARDRHSGSPLGGAPAHLREHPSHILHCNPYLSGAVGFSGLHIPPCERQDSEEKAIAAATAQDRPITVGFGDLGKRPGTFAPSGLQADPPHHPGLVVLDMVGYVGHLVQLTSVADPKRDLRRPVPGR